jgi:hypothetical protein
MAKTFIPTLVYMLKRVCVYIARYRSTIIAFAPPTAENALNGIIAACEVFLDLVEHPISP